MVGRILVRLASTAPHSTRSVRICSRSRDGRTQAGSQSSEEFDETVYDLVNYLAYSAEPIKADRQRIGIYVLLFIAVFFVFATLLNREYWKDVH